MAASVDASVPAAGSFPRAIGDHLDVVRGWKRRVVVLSTRSQLAERQRMIAQAGPLRAAAAVLAATDRGVALIRFGWGVRPRLRNRQQETIVEQLDGLDFRVRDRQGEQHQVEARRRISIRRQESGGGGSGLHAKWRRVVGNETCHGPAAITQARHIGRDRRGYAEMQRAAQNIALPPRQRSTMSRVLARSGGPAAILAPAAVSMRRGPRSIN